MRAGIRALKNSIFEILRNREEELSPRMVQLITRLYEDWLWLDERIEQVTGEIEKIAASEPNCRRLMSVPGVGPIISTAMAAAIGDGEAFERGRDFGAWLGLVPRQYSTGGRSILGRIAKWVKLPRRFTAVMLRRVNYVGIPTEDQDRALTFWTETMGCIIATDRPIGEKRWIELTIPGAQTGLLLLTPERHEDRVGTFFNGSFGCDDVHYTYEKLRARGVEFLGPPETRPFPHVYFKDPDGNTFLLSSR